MLGALPAHEDSGMIRSDSIVKALGVTDGASFEALMAALAVGKADGLGSQNVDDPTLVHPADAVTRLREFVEAESSGAAAAPTIGLAGIFYPNAVCPEIHSLCSRSGHTSLCNPQRLLRESVLCVVAAETTQKVVSV